MIARLILMRGRPGGTVCVNASAVVEHRAGVPWRKSHISGAARRVDDGPDGRELPAFDPADTVLLYVDCVDLKPSAATQGLRRRARLGAISLAQEPRDGASWRGWRADRDLSVAYAG